MCDNEKQFQLVNSTIEQFKQYIYLPDGNHCIGGKMVSDFITVIDQTVFN